ncbi:L-type lectin-domain containing receptor kinase IV.1-like [Macadamia integrifolia]|uniref:L-type lectin-domain containing receptor kinase IV.1-like n=1 Tax=Macadamia integrifolia TaxID=60698 RepID=UPI001C4F55EF|nr:L-type lectin-domain containing receptor kinase IV.1-like [Macadamia integrifolia]
MNLDGLAQITDNGLLMLINTTNQEVAHAFYPHPLHFRNSTTGNALSFSTTFVFAFRMLMRYSKPGMAFVIAPSREFSGALAGNYLSLFNWTNIGKQSNHVIAIELDCFRNMEFDDIDGNHVDNELNGRLGDFGLARLYDHGTGPQTTHEMGTLGYIAPELYRTGKANPCGDVFSFGIILLEVACGRRPIEREASEESVVLVDWVISCWRRGSILDIVDPKLRMN